MGSTPRSIDELRASAPANIKRYCDSSSRFAWPSYDVDSSPTRLEPIDVLAPAFLSYPIKRDYFEPMLQATPDGGHYAVLWEALAAVVRETSPDESFEKAFDRPESGAWTHVAAAIEAARKCKGLTSVAVSKILHRKRPNLVPIIDKRVRAFYAAKKDDQMLLQRIHQDLSKHAGLLDEWAGPYRLPTGQAMTRLRALDIAVWMEG